MQQACACVSARVRRGLKEEEPGGEPRTHRKSNPVYEGLINMAGNWQLPPNLSAYELSEPRFSGIACHVVAGIQMSAILLHSIWLDHGLYSSI